MKEIEDNMDTPTKVVDLMEALQNSLHPPLSDEEISSFFAYARENATEDDGTECQWASYTRRALHELRVLRRMMSEKPPERD